MTAEVLVRLGGAPEDVMKKLLRKGYYKTKAEVIRAGILELGKEYALIGSPAYYREQLERMTKKKKLKAEEVLKKLEKLEQ